MIEEEFDDIFQTLDCGVVYSSLEGTILKVNDAFVNITGVSREQVVGKRAAELAERLLPKAEIMRLAAPLAMVVEGKSPPPFQLEWSGKTLEISARKSVLSGNYIGVIRDITAWKKTNETLRGNEERFSQISNASRESIYSYDTAGRFTSANKNLCHVLERDIRDILGHTHAELGFSQSLCQEWEALHSRVYATDTTVIAETRAPVADGSLHDYEVVLNPLHDENGRITGIGGITRDITQQRKAEEKIRRERAFFDQLVEIAPEGIAIIDLQGRITRVNKEFIRMFGFQAHEIIGQYIDDLLIPEGYQEEAKRLSASLERGESFLFETIRKKKEGSSLAVSITGAPIRIEGKLEALYLIYRDITARKNAEEALRESEQNFRTLADSGRALIWTAGIDKLCNYFNNVWLEFTGKPLERELGNGWAAGVHPDDFQFCLDTYVTAFDNRKSFSMEYRLRRHDGEYRWILDDGSPRYDAKGMFIGYIGHCLDITDRKKADDEIRRLNAHLEQRVQERTEELTTANKELESFSYSISHDLRSPLRSIEGFSHIFLEEYGAAIPEKGREYLERVKRNTTRMGQLIDDLLKLARVTNSQLSKSKIDMSALATDIVKELVSENPSRVVLMDIEPDMRAFGDLGLMRVALANLLGNAWKFSSKRECAHISIGTVPDSPHGPAFFVRDDGVGFEYEYVDKLFSAFQRLHTEADFAGTGIGLATAARIVRRHGGEIWAESEVNKGATFYFTIPYKGETNISDNAAAARQEEKE